MDWTPHLMLYPPLILEPRCCWMGAARWRHELCGRRLRHGLRPGRATEIPGHKLALRDHSLEGIDQALLRILFSNVPEQHRRREQHGGGVHQIFPSNVWGAPVGGLEDSRTAATKEGGGSQAQTSNQTSSKIRNEIAVEVFTNNDVPLLWLEHHRCKEGVAELLGILDPGELLGDLAATLQEKAIGQTQHVGLVRGSHEAATMPLSKRESKAGHSKRTLPRDPAGGHRGTSWFATLPSLFADIHAFSVLPNYDDVSAWELGTNSAQVACRSYIGVER
mmetsp:Transcript_64125/g.171557  ORF Transcript_64125/g.171557 Transcript_64125/m.171557 type:complete len:277 (+) Transcript_64125:74-904(+)